MLVRPIADNEKNLYDAAVSHPIQSFAWGEFKKAMGQKVERAGFFDGGRLARGLQATFHRVPVMGGAVGYVPKGFMPDAVQIGALKGMAEKHGAVFIKLEPDVCAAAGSAKTDFETADKFMIDNGAARGKPLFTKYNFKLDLNKSADELFAALNSKTRYNVRLAVKKGVQIVEDASECGMETYIRLMEETTKRQNFFSHSPEYYRTMLKTIGTDAGSMMRIFHAVYKGQVLTAWIIFVFNGVIYYPYGASSDACREVMASNLMMWNTINYGLERGCKIFDMWGSLGPDPSQSDPWYGFHRFKEGYNPALMENLGTYDLVYNKFNYKLFNFADKLRWLKLRALGR